MKKDKRARQKLTLSRQTIRTLSDQHLTHIVGAATLDCDRPTNLDCAATDLSC